MVREELEPSLEEVIARLTEIEHRLETVLRRDGKGKSLEAVEEYAEESNLAGSH